MEESRFQNPPETPADTSVLAITPADTSTVATAKSEDEAKQKFDRDNKTVRGHLLNHMNNSLFDLFVSHKSAKDIWTTLETRYGGDDAGRKNEYRNHLTHKKRDLTLQELISHMRTEEANRLKDKETSLSTLSVKANLVESAGSKDRFHQNKGKKFQKNNQHKPFKAPNGKIQKNKLVCYCCGKPGHKAYQCYQWKDHQKANQKSATQGTPQVNLAEKDDEIIAVVVVEANLVENKEDWILDTGASRHFCSNRALFHELLETTDGECVFMGNSTTAGVSGKGKILLTLTSGKTLALNDVLFVPSLHRNLVSGSLLNKASLKIVLESDKVIITKNNDFVGKGYLSDGLFVLNTVPAVFNKTTSSSAYMIESYDVWHEAKYAKKPFKPVTSRSTELLELIHSDLADFKNTLSKGVLEELCDANWVIDNDEVSSTSGYVLTLGGRAISWKYAKQTCIAHSTMESKFIALELAGQEAEWLRNLLGDVPLWGSTVPVSLHCDSQAAIGIAKNYAYNGKRRHIRIRHGAVKELLKNGVISLDYVRSERNLVDPLRKGLTRSIIFESSRAMGLKPLD
ncbi:UNVERIFIED_CONTAM: Retrovirus-related Pol polyprotein from transposon TNT 1-94 [Sesamum latifolium]|uniref:Retrovirus-related Pol polyprotein from transposon TNT 1-94 n=1 Tax=Sesamum latifolium TaxID=2727402 RepID=A0AAW2U695_9LAMI